MLQALIGESSGVNFNQNDWGTPVGDASPIVGAAKDVRSWIIPTAEPYAFVVSGSAGPTADESAVERTIQNAFDALAAKPVGEGALAAARKKVGDAFAFDLDTSEEAAHQLAYFAGIGAFDRLLTLEADVKAVTPQMIAEAARRYLRQDQRTIAWLTPGEAAPASEEFNPAAAPSPRAGSASATSAAPAPEVLVTPGGAHLLFQRSDFSPTIAVSAVLAGGSPATSALRMSRALA